ncbi:hypothetical protein DLJ53_25565 [Acuticoccus sediminis]|uniref:Acyltransferase 3 domain-containing protein n=1 Tax=Acuticoccus sediminis TaxID=2184697 RepID=A0A8B2NKH8_9HYPH|nr:acyltransferase [Acuticoccus sediminis]RAH98997.1 hypothetical protein DLJ53_25565 [Acuticoccus sediminis]
MTDASGRSLPYYPKLDGLRAVAACLVLVEHFTYNEMVRGFAPGLIGVKSFFVLSGFLITSILLKERGTAPAGVLATRFYLRRALRLAPAYYAAILLTALLALAAMRQEWPWHAFYLSNVQIALQERWTGAGHFWTLATEEQFYLFWFPLVALAPRRWLLPVIAGCVILAPIYRAIMAIEGTTFAIVLLPGNIDSLAAGALLAVSMSGRAAGLAFMERVAGSRALLWGSLVAVVMTTGSFGDVVGWTGGSGVLRWVFLPVLVNVTALCAVRSAIAADGRFDILAHPALVHVGRISYGLYVWHYFVPQFCYTYIPGFQALDVGAWAILRTVIWLGLTVLIAEVSWRVIERPFLALKRRTPRAGRPVPARVEAAVPR